MQSPSTTQNGSHAQSNSKSRDQTNPKKPPQLPSRPSITVTDPLADASTLPSTSTNPPKKRRNRGGKKRRNRRQSFAAPPSEASGITSTMDVLDRTGSGVVEDEDEHSPVRMGESFYKRRNRSDESLDSDALLDHRYQQPMRTRRESRLNPAAMQRANLNSQGRVRSSDKIYQGHRQSQSRRTAESHTHDEEDEDEPTDRTPLMPVPGQHRSPSHSGYGLFKSNTRESSKSSNVRRKINRGTPQSMPKYYDEPGYHVNNPPSVPGSPHLNASIDDPMMPEPGFLTRSPDSSRNLKSKSRDALIDIDRQEILEGDSNSAPPSPRLGPDGSASKSRRTMTFSGGGMDVCLPPEALSEMGEDDFDRVTSRDADLYTRRRRKKREWPQLWVLEEWSREEKEERAAGERRAQRVHEPVLVEGRLRPSRPSAWHRENEAPFRYTYFNEEFEGTIHSQTISELVPPGGSFRELFIPDCPLLEDSSESESENDETPLPKGAQSTGVLSPKQATDDGSAGANVSTLNSILNEPQRSRSREPNRMSSILTDHMRSHSHASDIPRSTQGSEEHTPQAAESVKKEKPKRYGPRPTFWLDVMCPTDQEMRVLAKAFGIHALTAEDIMMQEAREKVELFKNYYFINYRTFEQDTNSENYLDPIDMYVVVFRHGILTFHTSQVPHPANVRRRIRQLKDYLILSADWISYAIIDDITDIYVPMIHNIEIEVDEIDEAILNSTPGAFAMNNEQTGGGDDKSSVYDDEKEKRKDSSGYNMLRRVGESRKKVMSLYRLLGNKADVIKGFAKRCNEQWDVAPKTEIGLYLGDIQDHILTMTGNLSHYETLLSRAHSNYLAQVSIRMNERSEQTSDILNKLTVLGTIVLPMNIICGMWGMNVKVPGQEIDNLWWFWGITAGLILFAVGCYLWCRRVYGIV